MVIINKKLDSTNKNYRKEKSNNFQLLITKNPITQEKTYNVNNISGKLIKMYSEHCRHPRSSL